MLSIYPLLALLIPLPLTTFSAEVITGCINEAAKGANKAQKICLLVFLFNVLLF